ncbi:hypothetical protein GGS23DRAFT_596978 [Durotheca rogersii]|uniref:uncharacterized protein n=1 Tax=Durotheca rogersii TaxID=419775 RepID=UPI002220B13B|nr:uncharacterized protein GGS23DRAFT_596978 [Durotheca rogersii]KAI5863209.1 hypothetical protein GGS23DRAFT_596978 [Durotheca rogersii]
MAVMVLAPLSRASVATVFAVFAALATSPATVSAQESLRVGRFFNPPNSLGGSELDFSNNPVWRVGDVETIKFTTTYSDYDIVLWQQDLKGAFATMGPAIFQTTSGAVTQFDWSVQVYGFDLKYSDVFFLWLSPLDGGDGDEKPLSLTTRYFNITEKPPPAPSSSSRASSRPSPSATTKSLSPPPLETSSPPPDPSLTATQTTPTGPNRSTSTDTVGDAVITGPERGGTSTAPTLAPTQDSSSSSPAAGLDGSGRDGDDDDSGQPSAPGLGPGARAGR